jgi:hypothetical protein
MLKHHFVRGIPARCGGFLRNIRNVVDNVLHRSILNLLGKVTLPTGFNNFCGEQRNKKKWLPVKNPNTLIRTTLFAVAFTRSC